MNYNIIYLSIYLQCTCIYLSTDSLSEQLVHSLLAQERVTIERDKALKRVKEEVENSKNLEKQLKRIQLLHCK